MPVLPDQQLARACRAVCASAGLRGFWGWRGPTKRADAALRAKGGHLSRGQHAALLAAWSLWNGRGGVRFAELVEQLEPRALGIVGELLTAIGLGSDAVEQFLEEHGQVPPTLEELAGEEPVGADEPEEGEERHAV